MNILISCLGNQTDIIEETIGLFNHNADVDLYAGNSNIKAMREQIERVDELWLIATDRKRSPKFNSIKEDFETVKANCSKYGAKIRIFVLQGVGDIVSENDAKTFHNLTLKVVSYAKQCVILIVAGVTLKSKGLADLGKKALSA